MKANILFATLNFDGHFKPLTSLAKHLQMQGYDVRWYTGQVHQQHLQKLRIPHYPFQKMMEITQANLEEIFPERRKNKGKVAKLKFDIREVFIGQVPGQIEDIKAIRKEFPFDLIIADLGFTSIPLLRALLNIPIIGVGVVPLTETSRDLPPYGFGLYPSTSFWGRHAHSLLRMISRQLVFKEGNREMNKLLQSYGLPPSPDTVFDMPIRHCDVFLQSGVPGFEYKRSDISRHIHFAGAILPYHQPSKVSHFTHQDKLKQYRKVILVTQGTVEKDIEKILVPTLEAFQNTDYLVIATTGGSQTQELSNRYPQDNIIIDDFIDFNAIMPHADVYITNGGYGGVMLGISHQLPLVVAGVHEGKNEICARAGYFKLGIDLKTETPHPEQIRKAVEEVLSNSVYKENVKRLAEEFHQYDPGRLCQQYVEALLSGSSPKRAAISSTEASSVVQ